MRKPDTTPFYVYCIFRPWNGEPCYIGKGKGNRSKVHGRYLRDKHPNPNLARIFAKASRFNLEVPVVIIREGLTELAAFEYEKMFIRAIGRKEFGGPLVNLTDGGEGLANPDIRTRERIAAARRGQKPSEETRRKLSAAHKGHAVSDERRQQFVAMARRPKTADHLKKISLAQKGRKLSAEARKRLREAHAKEPEDRKRERYRKLSVALKGRQRPPEVIEKMMSKINVDGAIVAHLAGQSIRDLAAEYGVSPSTLIRRFRQLGVEPRSRLEALRLKKRQIKGTAVPKAA